MHLNYCSQVCDLVLKHVLTLELGIRRVGVWLYAGKPNGEILKQVIDGMGTLSL